MSRKPKVLELGQINDQQISLWETMYEKRDDGYYCRTCKSKILQTTCHVSIHLTIFEPDHAGPGKVVKINMPYCPKCDGDIDYATACYHIWGKEPTLLEVGGSK